MLNQALILSLSVFGYSALFWEGMILEKMANTLEDRLPEFITKPLFACPICMIPWYGIPVYYLLWGWQIEMLPVIFIAMGINAVIGLITGCLQDIADGLRTDNTRKGIS